MEHQHLIWNEESKRGVFDCPVFSVGERICRSPDNDLKTFTVIDAPDWAIIVPVVESAGGKQFVMVKQWRHGSRELSLEFPGGVFEPGEDALEAAARELREETAYVAGTITKLGKCSPNPAIMSNQVHFFMAENLKFIENQELDEDEYLDVTLVSREEVFKNMGHPPYIHALMGMALTLYLQKTWPGLEL